MAPPLPDVGARSQVGVRGLVASAWPIAAISRRRGARHLESRPAPRRACGNLLDAGGRKFDAEADRLDLLDRCVEVRAALGLDDPEPMPPLGAQRTG